MAAQNTSENKRVAVLIELGRASGRGILEGVSRYARTHHPWSFFFRPVADEAFPVGLLDWQGDGIISDTDDPQALWILDRFGLPVVNTCHGAAGRYAADVFYDDRRIGKLAAEHLLERGHRRFAYLGENLVWAQRRGDAFAETVQAEGHIYQNIWPFHTGPENWQRHREEVSQALRKLEKPVGLFAQDDGQARVVIDLCRDLGFRVPEDVGVIGVDNDEVQAEMCNPPLSSIDPAADQRGHKAAELLDELMHGREAPRGPHLIPPRRVATRQSTDILAIEDQMVLEALHTIRLRARHGLTVTALVDKLAVSRRTLETRFAAALGRSPAAEIRRVQMQRAKTLLTETDEMVSEVAKGCGIDNPKSFSDIFSRSEGMSPRQYRKKHGRV